MFELPCRISSKQAGGSILHVSYFRSGCVLAALHGVFFAFIVSGRMNEGGGRYLRCAVYFSSRELSMLIVWF